MKILLLGANGQLGQTLLTHPELPALGELIPATRTGRLEDGAAALAVDLTNIDQLTAVLDQVSPQLIINAAAYTAVDQAEQEENLATSINGDAVGTLAEWSSRHGALLVHYSTDYIFDGRSDTPYPTDAAPAPINAYGRSKLAGEQKLIASGADYLLFRTAWVYSAHGRNFLNTMLRLGAERDQLRVVADQFGSPTTTTLIADGTLAALRRWFGAPSSERRQLNGVYHLVASGITSWHGFALAIMEQAVDQGLMTRIPRIEALSTLEFPTPARRPAWSVLDNQDFQRRFGFVLPDWRSGLSAVLDHIAHTSTRRTHVDSIDP